MPSFGGYGKPIGLYAVAALVPMLGGELLAFAYIQYFFYFFIGGIIAMLMLLLAVHSYSVTAGRGMRKIAADMQYPDGTQDFIPILYKDQPKNLGEDIMQLSLSSSMLQQFTPFLTDKSSQASLPDKGTIQLMIKRYRYAITDINGNDWLTMFDHPLPELVPSMDDTPLNYLIATIPTQKGTFLPLRFAEEPLSPYDIEPVGYLARHILKRKPVTSKEVREIYGVMTAARVKKYKDYLLEKFASDNKRNPPLAEEQELNQKLSDLGYTIIPPSFSEIKSMYDAWVDYRITEVKNELGQTKEALEKVNLLLLLKGGCEMSYTPPSPRREGIDLKMVLKYILASVGVVVAGYLIYLWLFTPH